MGFMKILEPLEPEKSTVGSITTAQLSFQKFGSTLSDDIFYLGFNFQIQEN